MEQDYQRNSKPRRVHLEASTQDHADDQFEHAETQEIPALEAGSWPDIPVPYPTFTRSGVQSTDETRPLLQEYSPIPALQRSAQGLSPIPAESVFREDEQVHQIPRLEHYDTKPRYALETMLNQCGVPAMTLHLWERRYGIPHLSSEQSTTNVLYSARDVVAVRWVRRRLNMGISVRQAMHEFARCEPDYLANPENTTSFALEPLPPRHELVHLQDLLVRALLNQDEKSVIRLLNDGFATYPTGTVCHNLIQPTLVQLVELRQHNITTPQIEMFTTMILRAQVEHLIEAGITPRDSLQQLSSLLTQAAITFETQCKEKDKWSEVAPDLLRLQDLLLEATSTFDESWLQRILDEAFFYYEIEIVCLHLLQPVLARLGQLWVEKKMSSTSERFLSNAIRTRLLALYQSTPHMGKGGAVWLGCVAKETHEIGIIMLALFWRRAGINVCYLGTSLEKKSLIAEIKRIQPAILCISLMGRGRLHDLCELGRECTHLENRPVFCFGGSLFIHEPNLIRHPGGIYLGSDVTNTTQIIKELLRMRSTLTAIEVEEIYLHTSGGKEDVG